MKILFLADKTRNDQPILFGNLAAAARACGDSADIVYSRHYSGNDVAQKYDTVCCWGWRHGKFYRDQGLNVLIAERGYVGDRFKWYSLGWNGLNGKAKFPKADSGGRWYTHHGMTVWRDRRLDGEGYALVLGQVPTDTSVRGIRFLEWARKAVEAMRQRGYTVHYRAHPQAPQSRPTGTPLLGGDLASALRGAAVAVTYNSNSGVDAVLAGVPLIACDSGSMAYPVAAHDLMAKIVTPDRTEWAHNIAWAQWLIEETALRSTWLKLKSVITDKE